MRRTILTILGVTPPPLPGSVQLPWIPLSKQATSSARLVSDAVGSLARASRQHSLHDQSAPAKYAQLSGAALRVLIAYRASTPALFSFEFSETLPTFLWLTGGDLSISLMSLGLCYFEPFIAAFSGIFPPKQQINNNNNNNNNKKREREGEKEERNMPIPYPRRTT